MKMKSLLTIIAILEGLTGIVILIIPSLTVSLLLGDPVFEKSGILLGRMFGIALISLSVGCWTATRDIQSSITMIKAIALYNIGAVSLLLYAGTIGHFQGIGLWPTVLIHTALLVGCVQSLRKREKS
jgi:hypothetical protein